MFADGLNSPELAKLLVYSLKSIESQVKELFKVNEETKTSQIKVTESLDTLFKKLDELENEIKKKDDKIQILENRVEELEKKERFHGN